MAVVKIKKQKYKKSVLKRKIIFDDYNNCLDATQFENKTNHNEKTRIDVDRFAHCFDAFNEYSVLYIILIASSYWEKESVTIEINHTKFTFYCHCWWQRLFF